MATTVDAGKQTGAVPKWYIVAARGVVAALVGLYLVVAPADTLLLLARIAAAYFLVDGVIRVFGVVTGKRADSKNTDFIIGGIGIAVGLIVLGSALLDISLSEAVQSLVIIVLGLQVVAAGALALRASRGGQQKMRYRMVGLAALAFGLVLLSIPIFGAGVTLTRIVGLLALVFGGVLLYTGVVTQRRATAQ